MEGFNIGDFFRGRGRGGGGRRSNPIDDLRRRMDQMNHDFQMTENRYRVQIDNNRRTINQLTSEKQNIQSKLNSKTEQYDKLLNDYNVQLKDKQGAMDYLTINEHFSNIEGLTLAETDAVIEIAGNLDWNFYNSIAGQNKQLDTEIQNYKSNYSTDDQKVFYQSQQVDYLNLFNSYLFIIYYALLVILCYFLYYSKTLSRYVRIGMIVTITLYPFLIMNTEKIVLNFIMYIFAIINGNAYIKNY